MYDSSSVLCRPQFWAFLPSSHQSTPFSCSSLATPTVIYWALFCTKYCSLYHTTSNTLLIISKLIVTLATIFLPLHSPTKTPMDWSNCPLSFSVPVLLNCKKEILPYRFKLNPSWRILLRFPGHSSYTEQLLQNHIPLKFQSVKEWSGAVVSDSLQPHGL